MDLNSVAVDPKAQEEGVWVQYDKDTSFLIAREDNPKYLKKLAKELEPYRTPDGSFNVPEGEDDRMLDRVYAETILLGWKGLTHNGKALKYSVEESFKIFNEPSLVILRKWILTKAKTASLFREESIKAQEKN